MAQHMISTTDNPFNPFTQFDEWYHWDLAAGYASLGLLARLTVTSDDLSEADQSVAIENAIDEMVQENVVGRYIKVSVASTV